MDFGLRHSQRGSAMMMALFMLSTLGISAVWVYKKFNQSQKELEHQRKIDSYKELVSYVRETLYSGNNCTSMFAKENKVNMNEATYTLVADSRFGPDYMIPSGGITHDSDGRALEIHLNFGPHPGPIRGHGPGYPSDPRDKFYIAGGTSLRAVKLMWNNTSFPGGDLIRENVQRDTPLASKPAKITAAYADLLLVADHFGDATGRSAGDIINPHLPEGREYRIRILTHFDETSGELLECFPPNGVAAACLSAGGVYNTDEGLGDYRCEPDTTCWIHQIGIGDTQSHCDSVSTTPPRYKAYPMGPDRWTCQWCNRHQL